MNGFRYLFCHSKLYKNGEKSKYSELKFTPREDETFKISLCHSKTPEQNYLTSGNLEGWRFSKEAYFTTKAYNKKAYKKYSNVKIQLLPNRN